MVSPQPLPHKYQFQPKSCNSRNVRLKLEPTVVLGELSGEFELSGRVVQVWALRLGVAEGSAAEGVSQGLPEGPPEGPQESAIAIPDPALARCARILTPEESARAARFRFERHRRSFILRRAALRILLGRYLHISPESVSFAYSAKGKPSLSNVLKASISRPGLRLKRPGQIRFNTSHSGDIALFAFALQSEIGVDVERLRPIDDMGELARQYFCPEETQELMALPPSQRQAAFFRCWTRKEAYLKATGEGLSAPLDGFQVTFGPGAAPRLVHLERDTAAAEAWRLHHLELHPQYAAALAYRDAPRPVDVRPLLSPAELLSIIR